MTCGVSLFAGLMTLNPLPGLQDKKGSKFDEHRNNTVSGQEGYFKPPPSFFMESRVFNNNSKLNSFYEGLNNKIN